MGAYSKRIEIQKSDFDLTKRQAAALFPSQAEMGRQLGISKQAVHGWKMDEPIPLQHALAIRFILKPESFAESA